MPLVCLKRCCNRTGWQGARVEATRQKGYFRHSGEVISMTAMKMKSVGSWQCIIRLADGTDVGLEEN